MKNISDKQKRAEIDYPLKLSKQLQKWEWTKPFGYVSRTPLKNINFPSHNAQRLLDFSIILKLLNLPLHSKILDVGCGGGWISDLLEKMNYKMVGIDISPHMINLAKKRKTKNVRFIVQDVEFLDLRENFDGVLIYAALHHMPNKKMVLSNLYKVLKMEAAKEAVKRYGTREIGESASYLTKLLKEVGFRNIKCHSIFEFVLPENIFKKISLFVPFILYFEKQHKINITCRK